MTAALLIGAAVIAAALVLLAVTVRAAASRIVTAMHEKPVTATPHIDIAHNTASIATALEGIRRSDKTVTELEGVSEKQEKLLLGIHEVLNARFTSDEALRPDVVVGQERGVAQVKDMLYAKLSEATK